MASSESLLVAHPDVVPASALVPLLRLNGKPGFVVADMTDVDEFAPIPSVTLPDAPQYVLRDVDRGDAMANWSPDEALRAAYLAWIRLGQWTTQCRLTSAASRNGRTVSRHEFGSDEKTT
jgi:hypothetical protein